QQPKRAGALGIGDDQHTVGEDDGEPIVDLAAQPQQGPAQGLQQEDRAPYAQACPRAPGVDTGGCEKQGCEQQRLHGAQNAQCGQIDMHSVQTSGGMPRCTFILLLSAAAANTSTRWGRGGNCVTTGLWPQGARLGG